MGENGAGKTTLMSILFGLSGAGRRRNPAPRRARPLPFADRRDGRRHGHGASVVQALRLAQRLGEHRLWHRAQARALHRPPRRRGQASPSSPNAIAWPSTPTLRSAQSVRRRAPAGRDPEGALSRRARPHSRRADRGADARRSATRCSACCGASRPRAAPSCSSPTSSTRSTAITDRVTVLRDGRTVASLATAETSAREIVRAMTGRNVNLKVEKGPAAARRAAPRPRRRSHCRAAPRPGPPSTG